MLFALMLAGLVLSTSIPEAFDGRALAFAGAYVVHAARPQPVHAVGAARAQPRQLPQLPAHQRVAGAVGACSGSPARSPRARRGSGCGSRRWPSSTWRPSLGFWTPGLGRSTTADWDVEGGHLAERCGLFIIIALGESILVTGATFAKLPWSPATVAAFVVGLRRQRGDVVDLFQHRRRAGAASASPQSSDPGRLARLAYTYMHLPLVAGIIVAAVGDELVLAHPTGHTDVKTAAAVLGGPTLYLIGNLMFKRATANRLALSHIVGLILLAGLVPLAPLLQPLTLAAAANLVLVLVAVWETRSLGTGNTEPEAGKLPTGEPGETDLRREG